MQGQTLEAAALPYSQAHTLAPVEMTQAAHQLAAPFVLNQQPMVELPDSSSHLCNCFELPSSSNADLCTPHTVKQGAPDQDQDNAAGVGKTSDILSSWPATGSNVTYVKLSSANLQSDSTCLI